MRKLFFPEKAEIPYCSKNVKGVANLETNMRKFGFEAFACSKSMEYQLSLKNMIVIIAILD